MCIYSDDIAVGRIAVLSEKEDFKKERKEKLSDYRIRSPEFMVESLRKDVGGNTRFSKNSRLDTASAKTKKGVFLWNICAQKKRNGERCYLLKPLFDERNTGKLYGMNSEARKKGRKEDLLPMHRPEGTRESTYPAESALRRVVVEGLLKGRGKEIMPPLTEGTSAELTQRGGAGQRSKGGNDVFVGTW